MGTNCAPLLADLFLYSCKTNTIPQLWCTRCAFRLLKSLQWYSGRKSWQSEKKLWKLYKSWKKILCHMRLNLFKSFYMRRKNLLLWPIRHFDISTKFYLLTIINSERSCLTGRVNGRVLHCSDNLTNNSRFRVLLWTMFGLFLCYMFN
jgi:hypothetical protein